MATKITSIANLKLMHEELKEESRNRASTHTHHDFVQIKVAMATCGIASGAKTVMDFMVEELNKRNIEVHITQTGCMGYCYAEPTIEVTLPNKEPMVFGYVDTKKADEIIERYIKKGELVDGIIPQNYETIDNQIGG